MPARSLLRDYLEALLVAVVLAIFARTFLVQAFSIPTGSMETNLEIGDHLLVNKFIFAPALGLEPPLPQRDIRRGDVVVFRFPEDPTRDFIKRCVALPGDRVEIRDKRLLVNQERVEEIGVAVHRDPHVYPSSRFLHDSIRNRDNFGPSTVPADHYFVLGDNRDHSNDSRFWGPVPASHVKGRALVVYWSYERSPPATDDTEAGAGWRTAGLGLWDLLTRTRWDRCFRLIR